MTLGRAGRRWLIGGALAAWAVLLVGIGGYSAFHDRPTWKDQTTVAQAHRTLDAATGEVIRAAGAAVVPALDGYEITAPCRITPARDGISVRRTIRLFTRAGAEVDLLSRIRSGLPPAYQADGPDPRTHNIYADAGNYVALRGGPGDPGEVRLRLSTDCRPGTDPTLTTPVDDGAGRQPVQRALDLLGVSGAEWRADEAPCPGGGQARTVQAEAKATGVLLDKALAKHPGIEVLAEPQRYAYRDGTAGVAVRASEGTLTITATTGCAAP